jgi:leucyl-tRNA synthetase
LQRLWRNTVDENTGELRVGEAAPDLATLRVMHRSIDAVTREMQAMRINTAIAHMIVLNNHLTSLVVPPRAAVEALVLMLAPAAPHISEELWRRLGHQTSLAHHSYPVADPQYVAEETITCVVQVMGKVRARLEVTPSVGATELEDLALNHPDIVKAIGQKTVRRVIVKPPGLVNVVTA